MSENLSNSCRLLGRVVRDPEVRNVKTAKGDVAVAKFALALNRSYKDANGESKENTDFVDCELWASGAEFFAEHAKKGARVLVEASVRQNKWEDADGNKRSSLYFRVNSFRLLDRQERNSDEQTQEPVAVGAVEDDVPF